MEQILKHGHCHTNEGQTLLGLKFGNLKEVSLESVPLQDQDKIPRELTDDHLSDYHGSPERFERRGGWPANNVCRGEKVDTFRLYDSANRLATISCRNDPLNRWMDPLGIFSGDA